MKNLILLVLVFMHLSFVFGQTLLEQKKRALELLKEKEREVLSEIETLKFQHFSNAMQSIGYPKSAKNLEIISHSAMILGFDCDYKMPAWVFHVLTPDVAFGTITRSNDFRIDEKVSCGSSVEADYFTKKEISNGKSEYDGFGFDRGHLAPSADFRWSRIALSESYYYSNMAPQRPEFNQESWADLEGLVRKIVDQEQKELFVVTGPVLKTDLPIVERSVHHLKIPELFYKIIVDTSVSNPRGMAFLMPNKKCSERLSSYVISIDSLERLTGLDFFPNLSEKLEKQIEGNSNFAAWKTQGNNRNVEPIEVSSLPIGIFNTQQAASKVGSVVSIVGKVVSTKYVVGSQSTFINLDQSFPNQLFTIVIWKDGRRNFSYLPEDGLFGKYIVVKGKIQLDKDGIPSVVVSKEEQIEIWDKKEVEER